VFNLRAEGRSFRRGRCLVPATEFFLSTGRGRARSRWRVTMAGEEWFCFAGVWQPAREDWPEAYAVITVPAGPDLIDLKPRHLAALPRRLWHDWLDDRTPAGALLGPAAAGTFLVERDGR